jgi:hypothetical protein
LLLARTRVTGAAGGDNLQQWSQPCLSESCVANWYFGYTYLTGPSWDSSLAATKHETSLEGPVFRGDLDGFAYHLFVPPLQRVLADLDGEGRMDHVDAFQLADQPTVNLLNHLDDDWSGAHSFNSHRPYWLYLKDGYKSQFSHSWSCANGHIAVTDIDADGRDDVLAKDDLTDPNAVVSGLYRRMSLADPFYDYGSHGSPVDASGAVTANNTSSTSSSATSTVMDWRTRFIRPARTRGTRSLSSVGISVTAPSECWRISRFQARPA